MLLRGLIDPIPELIDRSRFEIRLAQRLGVPVPELEDVPPQFIAAARIDMAVDRIQTEKRNEEIARQKRRSNPRRK